MLFPLKWWTTVYHWGFPDSSVSKEFACNAGDPGSIPGSGRSAREGIGYPLQCSWASLVAQPVKNLPAMRETWVWSLGWEDPLEKEKAPTPVFLPENSMDCIVHGVTKSQTWLSDFHFDIFTTESSNPRTQCVSIYLGHLSLIRIL